MHKIKDNKRWREQTESEQKQWLNHIVTEQLT